MLALLPIGVLVAVAAVSGPPSTSVPFAQKADAKKDPGAEFQAQLDLAQRMMTSGKWAAAKDSILAAIAKHEGADYVVHALPGIQDDLQRCTYWSTHTRPTAKDAVAGELLSYNASSGEIKLRYRRDKDAKNANKGRAKIARSKLEFENDFVVEEEDKTLVYVHPLVFKGPHSIELKCGPIGQREPRFFVCFEESSFYLAIFGVLVDLIRVEDDNPVRLASMTHTMNVAEPVRLKVQVNPSTIVVSLNGSQMATCPKKKGAWGQLGFMDFTGVEEIVLTGDAEPSWIEGQIDAAIQKQWAEFHKTYDPLKELPEWLRARAASKDQAQENLLARLPGPADEQSRALVERASQFDAKGEYEPGAAWARGLAAGECSEPRREWLLALFSLGLGRSSEALEHMRKVAELDASFFPAQSLEKQIRIPIQSRAKSLVEQGALLERFPAEPEAHAALATVLLMCGQPEEAKAVLERAAKASVSSGELDDLRGTISRAVKGPEWGRAFEYSSTHYEVRSDLSRELCFDAAQALETMYKKLDVQLRRVGSQHKGRFRVYLFSGRSGYSTYCKNLLGEAPENTAGLYSPVLKQLLIWNLPERAEMMRTVRHEGFHQYFDQVADHAPNWLNEGLAEYFELSRRIRGRWQDGLVHAGHLALLQDPGTALVPLPAFLAMDAGGFYADAQLNYAQAWAFVHYLLQSGDPQRKRFDTLLDALIAGESTPEALERAFPAGDLAGIEKQFREYVATLSE